MDKVKNVMYPFAICFVTGLLWGVIIGSVSISLLVSSRIDVFYDKIAYLENTLNEKEEKLAKLEKSINNKNIVLKDVEVILEYVNFSEEQINRIDNIVIEKSVKEKYRSSLGKEVKSLDAELLQQIIDKRILKFDGTEYQLIVKRMVLTDILKLWVQVSLIEVES